VKSGSISAYRVPGFSVRSTEPAEIMRLCAVREPATTLLMDAVRRRPLGPGQRAWVVDGPRGVAAVLVVDRLCFDRWFAWPVLFDAEAAAVVAELVDSSRAWAAEGAEADVVPLIPSLRRGAREAVLLPFFEGTRLVDEATPDSVDHRTRIATRSDLDRLVDLYRGWELGMVPTVPRLRRYLRVQIGRGPVIVLEERGRLLAAAYAEARSERYMSWTGLTVHPEHRGRGLGPALFALAALIAKQSGLQVCTVWSRSNEVRIKPRRVTRMVGGYEIGTWAHLALGPPRKRVRGEFRARALLERLEGPVTPRALPVRVSP
jgi:N-acetylglutamate synthase-like GNAT family acetyltransferase